MSQLGIFKPLFKHAKRLLRRVSNFMLNPSQKILVCGSLAFDHLLRFQGSFKQYQTEYRVEALNASLPIHEYRTCYGGCGGNIAYGLGLLGVPTILLSHAGDDFEDSYRRHLFEAGVNCDYVAIAPNSPISARCTIISDDHGNQITGFYPGDAGPETRLLPSELSNIGEIDLAHLGPEAPDLMVRQAKDLHILGIPFIFDPGQWVSKFTKEDLRDLLDYARYVIGNEHEMSVLAATLEIPTAALAEMTDTLITTRAADGVDLAFDSQLQHVPAITVQTIVDATGSGDAFRAGLIFGLSKGKDLLGATRLGCQVAACALGSQSPQDYVLPADGIG
jgi:adenosine kinase